jgi:hypothetical protein
MSVVAFLRESARSPFLIIAAAESQAGALATIHRIAIRALSAQDHTAPL